MELIKKNINICRKKKKFSTQTVVNEDLNLPDYMEDIEKVIIEKGEFYLEQVRALTDKIIVKGKLKYCLLYSGGNPETICSFVKETAVNEEINAEGVIEYDDIAIMPIEENFKLNVINSRKINVKAVIGFDVSIHEVLPESITVDVMGEKSFQMKKKKIRPLMICFQNNDIFRFHNQTALPNNLPNMDSILYECINPKELELKCADGCILVSGRMQVFVMYTPEGKNGIPECFDYEFSIDGEIDCAESKQGMIGDIRWYLSNKELEIKDDSEDEPRIISVSGVINVAINLYEEEEIDSVDDAYCIDKFTDVKTRPVMLPKLLMKNNSMLRVTKRMKVAEQGHKVLKICNIEGDIRQENVTLESDMMVAEGHVFVKLLYMTEDENQPFRLAAGAIPYSHRIEAGGMNDGCKYRIDPIIESINASLEGNDFEIRIQIAMDVIVFDYEAQKIIDDIGLSDIPKELIKDRPGMVGYIAGENECLWDVAKKYHTSVDRLKAVNKLSDENLRNGQKLLIVKEII